MSTKSTKKDEVVIDLGEARKESAAEEPTCCGVICSILALVFICSAVLALLWATLEFLVLYIDCLYRKGDLQGIVTLLFLFVVAQAFGVASRPLFQATKKGGKGASVLFFLSQCISLTNASIAAQKCSDYSCDSTAQSLAILFIVLDCIGILLAILACLDRISLKVNVTV